MPEIPTADELVADLRALRMRGLVHLRHTDLPNLLRAAAIYSARTAPYLVDGSAAPVSPQAVENLVRKAVLSIGGGELERAAVATFGLEPAMRDKSAQERRSKAAMCYYVSVERFRKGQEPMVIGQVAEQILKLIAPPEPSQPPEPSRPADPPVSNGPEPGRLFSYSGQVAGFSLKVSVRCQRVEVLTDADILVVPTNSYLELPHSYNFSVSAAVRRMAAIMDSQGQLDTDVVAEELAAWVRTNGRPGFAVPPGTVAPTGSGEMSRQRIYRLYHVAVAMPQFRTNTYLVDLPAIIAGVRNVLMLARGERARMNPAPQSIAFPLLGAGRGGLTAEDSFDWLWSALMREIAEAASWEIQFFDRDQDKVKLIMAKLVQNGLVADNGE
jgi:hypothetical protein